MPFSYAKAREVERRPCAGIIRYTFIRLKRSLPLSHNGPRVRKRYYMVRRVSRLVFHMSAKSLVKWKNGFRVFPKVLGLRENTEPIDMRESRCRLCQDRRRVGYRDQRFEQAHRVGRQFLVLRGAAGAGVGRNATATPLSAAASTVVSTQQSVATPQTVIFLAPPIASISCCPHLPNVVRSTT